MDIFSEPMRRDPYPTYARARETSPLLYLPEAGMWAVFDYEGVKRALYDHEAFSSDLPASRGARFEWLPFLDPPRHAKLRAIITRAFTPRSIAGLEPRVRELSRGLLDDALGRGEFDLVADFGNPLPTMAIAEMLGVPVGEWPALRRWSEATVNLTLTLVGSAEEAAAAGAAFAKADGEMRDYLGRRLAERRAAPRDDLLTRLATAEVDGERLGEDEIVHFVQLLLAAGIETTTNLISNAVLCFLEHPAELARVREDPALLPSAIEEVLRYRSSFQSAFRVARRPVELHGRTLPAGAIVLATIGSANRDPAHFEDADRFDVGRNPNPHLAFGHGIHFCLGAALSRLEARVGLADFLARAPSFALAGDGPWRPRASFQMTGPVSLPLRLGSGGPRPGGARGGAGARPAFEGARGGAGARPAFEGAIDAGVAFLRERQAPNGEIADYFCGDERMRGELVYFVSPFPAAFVADALRHVDHPDAGTVVAKARTFLLDTMEGPGLWRYWYRDDLPLPPDADVTACAGHALAGLDAPPSALAENRRVLAKYRDDDGLFYTWLDDGGYRGDNDVDSVVNANVILYLGETPETRPAIEFLNQLIEADEEADTYWYYLDDLALYYTMSRALYRGVDGLAKSRAALVERARRRRAGDGSFGSDLQTAMALLTLLNCDHEGPADLAPALEALAGRQRRDGSWACEAFYAGPPPPDPRQAWFGSAELTTGLCLEALARGRSKLRRGG